MPHFKTNSMRSLLATVVRIGTATCILLAMPSHISWQIYQPNTDTHKALANVFRQQVEEHNVRGDKWSTPQSNLMAIKEKVTSLQLQLLELEQRIDEKEEIRVRLLRLMGPMPKIQTECLPR